MSAFSNFLLLIRTLQSTLSAFAVQCRNTASRSLWWKFFFHFLLSNFDLLSQSIDFKSAKSFFSLQSWKSGFCTWNERYLSDTVATIGLSLQSYRWRIVTLFKFNLVANLMFVDVNCHTARVWYIIIIKIPYNVDNVNTLNNANISKNHQCDIRHTYSQMITCAIGTKNIWNRIKVGLINHITANIKYICTHISLEDLANCCYASEDKAFTVNQNTK